MMNEVPVKIPEIAGRIGFKKQDGMIYVRYLAKRNYDADSQSNRPDWVNIGRRIERMPSMMYPNDNYEKFFGEDKEEAEEEMSAAEERYARDNGIYGTYYPFFIALYNEFKQQVRRNPDTPVQGYKAESINRVLRPLREMMEGEVYAGLLGMVETGEEAGMTYGEVMILLTQYKSALSKYRRSRL